MKPNKGFTLIELLVVIAIIGILSAVVLASLNTARDRGSNAAAMSNLNNARAQAALFYDRPTNGGNYTGVCGDTTNGIKGLFDAAKKAGAGGGNCASDANNWAAEVQLKSTGAGWYCVDSNGAGTTSVNTFGIGAGTPAKTQCN